MNYEQGSVAFAKSKTFSLRIVKLYKFLCDEKKEYVLSKQLLRAGTSIGANLAEARCAISKKDFLNKAYISFKECQRVKKHRLCYRDCRGDHWSPANLAQQRAFRDGFLTRHTGTGEQCSPLQEFFDSLL